MFETCMKRRVCGMRDAHKWALLAICDFGKRQPALLTAREGTEGWR
jgi:hypothetical protein